MKLSSLSSLPIKLRLMFSSIAMPGLARLRIIDCVNTSLVLEYLARADRRLGGETSGSEQKGVMQWTGLELKAKLKWQRVLNKMARLGS